MHHNFYSFSLASFLIAVYFFWPLAPASQIPVSQSYPESRILESVEVPETATGGRILQYMDPDAEVGEPIIIIDEYSDFSCPYCKDYSLNTFPLLRDSFLKYPQIDYRFHYFPLHESVSTRELSKISYCAEKMGVFWDVHTLLFENPALTNWSDYRTLFENVLDDSALGNMDACLVDNDVLHAIESSLLEAKERGVEATPSFVINGNRRIVGAKSAQYFIEVIEEELARQGYTMEGSGSVVEN